MRLKFLFVHKALYKKALYIPSYKEDMFSVHYTVSKGATVNLQC